MFLEIQHIWPKVTNSHLNANSLAKQNPQMKWEKHKQKKLDDKPWITFRALLTKPQKTNQSNAMHSKQNKQVAAKRPEEKIARAVMRSDVIKEQPKSQVNWIERW